MTDFFQDLRRALAELPKVEQWFVVGAPWGKGDFIVAGNPDPHLGQYVADTENFDGEGQQVLENAAFIAAANPFTVRLLLAELDALRATVALFQRPGLEAAARWIDQRRDAFDAAFGQIDPDTGTVEFGRGATANAREDYSNELAELAEGIRGLSKGGA
ncbi:hypothetical protein KW843_07635 [Acidovorax sp. sif1233]|uniref:hypothetical protein n=1 Tax=Acidovorax sp. sif1233 TaxID=2854792 RepID=UPI001C48F0E3|nr:hypothetical protein [Acidovorax sp. sif1233]MBV7454338.1 hypothetical protein [Acidovorax sp. sif1233]